MQIVNLFLLSLLLCTQISVSFLAESPITEQNKNGNEKIQLFPTEQEDQIIPFSFGPQPDTCPEKLEKLKKCLNKKADFVALNLKFYRYKIQRSCFCFPAESIAKVDAAVCDKNNSVPEFYENENTLLKIFDVVCDSILEADRVDVFYHKKYHFPTYFSIDYISFAIDDEKSYLITDFEILSEDTCIV